VCVCVCVVWCDGVRADVDVDDDQYRPVSTPR